MQVIIVGIDKLCEPYVVTLILIDTRNSETPSFNMSYDKFKKFIALRLNSKVLRFFEISIVVSSSCLLEIKKYANGLLSLYLYGSFIAITVKQERTNLKLKKSFKKIQDMCRVRFL